LLAIALRISSLAASRASAGTLMEDPKDPQSLDKPQVLQEFND
jgi:hypothetical protein